jgi:GNAT superfamily N-acetyltransferase
MGREPRATATIEVHPLTPDRWPDLVLLFGDRGDPAWCWCSWLRVRGSQHGRADSDRNRERLQRAAGLEPPPGLVAYRDGIPVGWVSIAPRGLFEGIGDVGPERADVWSITCFVVRRDTRRQGLTGELLRAAVEHARAHGARAVEGYPTEPQGRKGSAQLWTGVRSTFEAAGFEERGRFDTWSAVPAAIGPEPRKVGRPPGRPVMRLELR